MLALAERAEPEFRGSGLTAWLNRLDADSANLQAALRWLRERVDGVAVNFLRARDVEANDDYNRKFIELYELYDNQCQREGVVDFAELLLRTWC